MGNKDTTQPLRCSIVPRWVRWSMSAASSPRPNKSEQQHMVSRPLCAQKSGLGRCQGPITGPSLPRLSGSVELHPRPWQQPSLAPSWPRAIGACAVRQSRVQNRQYPVRTLASRVPNKRQATPEPAWTQLVSSRDSALERQFRVLSPTLSYKDWGGGSLQVLSSDLWVSRFPLLRSRVRFVLQGAWLQATG